MDAATILAAMLTLGRPGASPYSMVDLPDCGADPKAKAAGCPEEARWDGHWGAWIRRESPEEAKARWGKIAAAIERAVTVATSGDDPLWRGDADDLARTVVTIAYHESGFRRDVHAGRGYLGVGDCIEKDKKRVCRSFCLMQISTGGPEGKQHGERGRDLVGTDDAATDRCFTVGVKALAKVKGAGTGATLFRNTIARYGGGSLSVKEAPWVNERVATFERVARATIK